MRITQEWRIDCPPTTAFDLMADLRNTSRWNDTCTLVEMVTDGPVATDSRFHLAFGAKRNNDVTITRFDRPDRLEFAGTSKPMDVDSVYTFTPVDGGTQMRGTFDVTPKGVMRVLLPLVAPIARRDLAKHHAKFRALCESHSTQDREQHHITDES